MFVVTSYEIISKAADERIPSTTAEHGVIACAAIGPVIPGQGLQLVVAIPADQCVVSAPAIKTVIAGAAIETVCGAAVNA